MSRSRGSKRKHKPRVGRVNRIEVDKDGNVLIEEHDDGYYEENNYYPDGKLKRSYIHYANGVVEVENYAPSRKDDSEKQ
jgi:hypothetical protein